MADCIAEAAEQELARIYAARKATTGTVADIADTDLLRRAVRNAHSSDRRRHYRWSVVMSTFALGSTYARQLCHRFDLDPDEMVGR